jgi:hypothetical protein
MAGTADTLDLVPKNGRWSVWRLELTRLHPIMGNAMAVRTHNR